MLGKRNNNQLTDLAVATETKLPKIIVREVTKLRVKEVHVHASVRTKSEQLWVIGDVEVAKEFIAQPNNEFCNQFAINFAINLQSILQSICNQFAQESA